MAVGDAFAIGLDRHDDEHAEYQRQQQPPAAQREPPGARSGRDRPMAIPEIMNNSGIRQRLSDDHRPLQPFGLVAALDVVAPIGHVDHADVIEDEQAEGDHAQGIDVVAALHGGSGFSAMHAAWRQAPPSRGGKGSRDTPGVTSCGIVGRMRRAQRAGRLECADAGHPIAPSAQTSWDRYLPMRRSFEVGYWLVSFCLSAVVNSVTVLMDYQRDGRAICAWEPMVVGVEQRIGLAGAGACGAVVHPALPAARRHLAPPLALYLAGSVAWSLLHVLGMVGLRKLAYALQGGNYDFGDWPRELFYEYLKDALTFARHGRGHPRLPHAAAPPAGRGAAAGRPGCRAAVEPIDRPERFLVRKLNREFLVATDDIEWLQASGNYVNLHVAGRDYPLRSTIAAIEARLDPAAFPPHPAQLHGQYRPRGVDRAAGQRGRARAPQGRRQRAMQPPLPGCAEARLGMRCRLHEPHGTSSTPSRSGMHRRLGLQRSGSALDHRITGHNGDIACTYGSSGCSST